MPYFVIEEDINSKNKVYLDDINLDPKERRYMLLGMDSYIPANNLLIQLRHRVNEEMPDYLSIKFTFASHELREIIEDNAKAKVFYRNTFLFYDSLEYNYYYFSPQKFDCLDFKNSNLEKNSKMSGLLRISGGFSIKESVVEDIDIFRVAGLSSRTIVISEKLKKVFEENEIKGIKYTSINQWSGL